MSSTAAICALEDLGVLKFRGADVVRFLQGQLSNDVAQLAQQPGLLAGYHNPQGRVLALLRLVQRDADEILAVLPAALLAPTLQALRRFVLRSKVTISDESATARVFGCLGALPGDLPPGAIALPLPPVTPSTQAAGVPLRAPAATAADQAPGTLQRWILIDLERRIDPAVANLPADQWHALDIAAGLPQVYAATSAQFVAQMLNLDCVDGISFNKGCYTGQEVIARAHYRGRVKRRMRRFRTSAAAVLAPGDSRGLPDGRIVHVIDAVQTTDGHCEFLGISAAAPNQNASATGDIARPSEVAVPAVSPVTSIDAIELHLPYKLPD